MKRPFTFGVLAILAFGFLAVITPTPVRAIACVQCPVIEDPQCPPCYELVPQTCDHCAYCKRIKRCKP